MAQNSYSNTCSPELRAGALRNWLQAACLSLALPAAAVFAQDMEAARTAWVEGDYIAAAEIAAGTGTADGYALAAESLGIYGYFVATGDEQEALYDEALRYAEQAVELDPESPNTQIQLSHAIGRIAEIAGVMAALNNGYARQTLDLLEVALALDPESAPAHSGIAMWHARALDEGGVLARMMFGASRDKALEHVELSLEHGAGDKLIIHDAAASLLFLSERRHGDRARDLLLEARDIPVVNARDEFVQQSIEDILAALDD